MLLFSWFVYCNMDVTDCNIMMGILVFMVKLSEILCDMPCSQSLSSDDLKVSASLQFLYVSLCLNKMVYNVKYLTAELGHWVKPRSTTWFSIFLLIEYDNDCWLENFHMTKGTLFDIANQLRLLIQKHDMKYKLDIPMELCVAYAIKKLSQGVNLLVCSELFAIGKSTISHVVQEVITSINIVFTNLISWPSRSKLEVVMIGFKSFYNLPNVHGAIDGIHFAISRPISPFCENYYYHKIRAYNAICQIVFDDKKQFIDIFVRRPRSVNDSWVLWKSNLYHQAHYHGLFNAERGCQNGIPPYMLGDKGYPLLDWLVTPHQEESDHKVLQQVFNRKHKQGKSIVKNAFWDLQENHGKIDMHVLLIPDSIILCILNNLLGSHEINVDIIL